MERYFFILWIGMLFAACGNDEAPDQSGGESPAPAVVPAPTPERVPLTVNLNYFRLRDKPGSKGQVVTMLSEGDVVYDLNETSDFTTALKLRGVQYNDPWIKVETADGEHTGWVYGGGLSFDPTIDNAVTRRLMERRIENMFGDSTAAAIRRYQTDFKAIRTETDFAQLLRTGNGLLDGILGKLEDILDVDYITQAPDGEMPDLFWLETVLPGFEEALVAEGTAYDFFTDWKQWAPIAARTSGEADDQYVDLMFSLYRDSVEYYYPAYFLQTWDYGGDSELGSGVHFKLLDKMNRALALSDLFAPEIERHKTELLDDILRGNSYWLKQEQILEELDAILEGEFGLLTEEDMEALRARRTEFAAGPKKGLILNNRQLGVMES